MTDQLTKPFTALFENTANSRLPEPMQNTFEYGLNTTREATLQSITLAKQSAEAVSKAAPIAADATVALTAKAFEQAIENTEAAFAVARAIVRAKSPTEALKLQTKYSQAQLAKVGKQAKELFELSTKIAEQQIAGMKASTPETLGQLFKG